MYQCQTVIVSLKNEVLASQGIRQGTFELSSARVNGKPSWISDTQAIWWISQYNEWGVGDLGAIGGSIRGLTAVAENKDFKSLTDEKYVWKYWNKNSFVLPGANDISVQCTITPQGMSCPLKVTLFTKN